MAREKKAMTPTQEKKRYKRISRLCYVGGFVSAAIPYPLIALFNQQRFFIQADGLKITIGGIVGIVCMLVAIGLIGKKKFPNSLAPLLMGWAAFIGILFLLDEVIDQLKFFMLFGLVGLVGTYGLHKVSDSMEKKAEKKQKGIDAGEEELTKEAYIKEKQEREEKKRIKIIRKK